MRDPERRARILRAATGMLAERGYHAVSMADLGAAAGIVGSGVYRHFGSKSAVLVALFDDVMERLLATTVAAPDAAPLDVLAALVHGQVLFAVDDRLLLRLYQREAQALPEADRRRLRRLQRHYVESWGQLLATLRPELAPAETRALVHAAVGAVQSVAAYEGAVPRDRLVALLTTTAYACLGVRP